MDSEIIKQLRGLLNPRTPLNFLIEYVRSYPVPKNAVDIAREISEKYPYYRYNILSVNKTRIIQNAIKSSFQNQPSVKVIKTILQDHPDLINSRSQLAKTIAEKYPQYPLRKIKPSKVPNVYKKQKVEHKGITNQEQISAAEIVRQINQQKSIKKPKSHYKAKPTEEKCPHGIQKGKLCAICNSDKFDFWNNMD